MKDERDAADMKEFIIEPARGTEDAEELGRMASEIWHEHYAGLLSREQIDYMVAKFQSPDVIAEDMRHNHYTYYIAYLGTSPAGYCAIRPDEGGSSVFVSKVYVKKEFRGQGLARQFLNRVSEDTAPAAIQWLTVNKYNEGSIAAYKRLGFTIEEAMVTDIGGGFVMDDYKMCRTVSR